VNAYWGFVAMVAGINAIAAWSLAIAIRSGQLSIGHAAFAGLAGYTAGILDIRGVPLLLCFLAAAAVSAAMGLIFSVVALRLQGLLLAVASLAFGQAVMIVISSRPELGGATGLTGVPLNVTLPEILAVLAVLLAADWLLVRRSAFNLRLHLLENDPLQVTLTGRSWQAARVISFTLSTGVVGIAGAFEVFTFGIVQPSDLSFDRSLNLVVFAAVGGVYSGIGPMLGAGLLTAVPQLLSFTAADRTILYSFLLLLVMLVRPYGLVPRRPVRVLDMLLGKSWQREYKIYNPSDVPGARRTRAENRGTPKTTVDGGTER